jgi:hypothetical protein
MEITIRYSVSKQMARIRKEDPLKMKDPNHRILATERNVIIFQNRDI